MNIFVLVLTTLMGVQSEFCSSVAQPEMLGAGDHKRSITMGGKKRLHKVHVPPSYDPKKEMPVLLALHGAAMYDKLMEDFTGLNKTADKHQFIVVYPNGTGTGPGGLFQTWNAGQFPGPKNNNADDVKYLGAVLNDVENAFKIDKKRVYVCGLSNGAMMSYRLAAEIPERIAAIGAVAGTMAIEKYEPKRPVPVVHFHGTKDTLVPFHGPDKKKEVIGIGLMKFHSVDYTIMACVKANGCHEKPVETVIEMKADKLKVIRKDYGKGKGGAEVILYVVENGGHTWPGGKNFEGLGGVLGETTSNISANEVMWEFFQRHALK